MKPRFNTAKNSYGARVFPVRDEHQQSHTLLLGHRATLYSQSSKECHSSGLSQEEDFLKKESKFQLLKQEISKLQNSQFLSLKYRCHTEPDCIQENYHRTTGKQFMPRKKITQLEKFKMNLKRKGRTRKVSMLLDKNTIDPDRESNYFNLLEVKDFNRLPKESSLKKKETPSIVRKYYRPQTGSQPRSMSELTIRDNAIRGRGLRSSATNRAQKENVLIYCY